MLASGSDDGTISIRDLRLLKVQVDFVKNKTIVNMLHL